MADGHDLCPVPLVVRLLTPASTQTRVSGNLETDVELFSPHQSSRDKLMHDDKFRKSPRLGWLCPIRIAL